jgi:hypothetical protein
MNWREILGVSAKDSRIHTQNTQNTSSPQCFEDIGDDEAAASRAQSSQVMAARRTSTDSPVGPRVLGALFREGPSDVAPDSHKPPFPPCPECGQSRYWIVGHRVVCGSRHCGHVRWILTSIEFHSVQ